MEIQIDKHESENEINLVLLIKLAKDYAESLNEPYLDDDCIPESTEETKTNEFIYSLLPLNGFLLIYDISKQSNVDLFMQEYLDHVQGCSVLELTYVLETEEYSIFSSNEQYMYQRITDIDSAFDFLEHITEETTDDIDRYIIINQFFTYYSYDHTRFIKDIKLLLNSKKIHLVLISHEYDLLNEDVLKLFEHRCAMWLGSTKVSKAIMGTNILCSPIEDNQIVYTGNFAKTFDIKTFKDENSLENIDNLLDI